MIQFILRRLVFLIVVVLVTTILTFVLAHSSGVDPARLMAGAHATPEQLTELRRRFGLDRPWPVQYILYLNGLVHGDFGQSLHTQRAINLDLLQYLPATVELVIAAMAIAVVGGVSLGALAGVFRDGPIDAAARLLSLSGLTVPVFWLGLLCQWLFYDVLGWLPSGGQLDIGLTGPPTVTGFVLIDSLLAGRLDLFGNACLHLLLPALVLSFAALASITRMMRNNLIDVLRLDYVRTARSKGVPQRVVVVRHAMRNAMLPTLTTIGLQFGALLGGTILVEIVFSWPGIGLYLQQSIIAADYNPVLAVTVVIAAFYVLTNLVVDVSYVVADPRIRAR
ncbi:MAG TPA: ABC transporter permease [Chloroflexota bacterium]|nr:ABC transporter permease [Chloroflexota bacterium]